MGMAALLSLLVFCFCFALIPAVAQNLLSCDTMSADASGYRCNGNGLQDQCSTFAVLRANPYYSSLSNLSFYLGLSRRLIAEANGFSVNTELLMKEQPLLIPISCRCNGGFFQAELIKTSIKGESFDSIAESLEGLTTCRAIQEKNPSISGWGLQEGVRLHIPVRCACPSSSEFGKGTKFLLSYPVLRATDTVPYLASRFNTTAEAVIAANNRSVAGTQPGNLVAGLSLLIPLRDKPILVEPRELNPSLPVKHQQHKKHSKGLKIGISVALGGVALGATAATAVAFFFIQKKRRKGSLGKMGDMELQQLGLSTRTTSDKKVSFEGSQVTLESQAMDPTTPRKHLVETYTLLELRKSTEDFSSTNHIDGAVFHGRLNGKNLAIKRVSPEIVPKIEFRLFQDSIHHHPNIVRLFGTCLTEGPSDMYLVFEYARNGSLKDWLHGGLAMKSQFISSCYCFLNWSQRLRICLDVASALQFMHHIMNPSYVHRNIRSRNIFLDEEFNAKVGNFVMSKCMEDHTTGQELEESVYLAPEYIREGITAPGIDVFAYGIVLMEVLCGLAPITGGIIFSDKIKSMLQSENVNELREWMDGALGENYSLDGAVALANLARACVEEEPSSRPSAGEIVENLSRLVEELPETEGAALICESSCKPLVKATANDL